MNFKNNTILITGGAGGIGLALALHLYKSGNEIIVCGRRLDALQAAQAQMPGLHVYQCDLASTLERIALAVWATEKFPKLNVLVNNAGIQNFVQLDKADNSSEGWAKQHEEITINFEAPVHLTTLLLPHLKDQDEAAIINVTSGLAFVPYTAVPVYCATKAALHSFTLSLRHQLKATGVKVLEIVPPAVNTDLGGPGLHTYGVPVNDFANAVVDRLAAGEQEVGFGGSEEMRKFGQPEIEARFKMLNDC